MQRLLRVGLRKSANFSCRNLSHFVSTAAILHNLANHAASKLLTALNSTSSSQGYTIPHSSVTLAQEDDFDYIIAPYSLHITRKKPSEVATALLNYMSQSPDFSNVVSFAKVRRDLIFVQLHDTWLANQLQLLLSGRVTKPNTAKSIAIDIEPPIGDRISVGSLRSLVLGESLARLHDFIGYSLVTAECHTPAPQALSAFLQRLKPQFLRVVQGPATPQDRIQHYYNRTSATEILFVGQQSHMEQLEAAHALYQSQHGPLSRSVEFVASGGVISPNGQQVATSDQPDADWLFAQTAALVPQSAKVLLSKLRAERLEVAPAATTEPRRRGMEEPFAAVMSDAARFGAAAGVYHVQRVGRHHGLQPCYAAREAVLPIANTLPYALLAAARAQLWSARCPADARSLGIGWRTMPRDDHRLLVHMLRLAEVADTAVRRRLPNLVSEYVMGTCAWFHRTFEGHPSPDGPASAERRAWVADAFVRQLQRAMHLLAVDWGLECGGYVE